MKNVTFFKSLAAVAALALSTSAWAVPVEVGGLDSLAAAVPSATFTNPDDLGNSSDAQEIAWVNDILGTSFDSYVKIQGGSLSVTNDGTSYYFSLNGYTPAYYFVKFGVPNGQDTHYLFVNNDSTSWAYFLDTIEQAGGVSHIGLFGGRTTVPEPTSLALLGLGLAGLGFARRRKA